MTFALPGSRGLFSLLHDAFRADAGPSRIRLSPNLHQILADFATIHHQLHTRPTRLAELIPLQPTVHGAHDAAKAGAGGVLLPMPHATPRRLLHWHLTSPSPTPPPVVWRYPFPREIQHQLATSNRPGPVSNSDLELAGSLLQHEVGAQCFDLRERTIRNKLTTSPPSFGPAKALPRPPNPQHTCFVSCRCINAFIVTSPSTITFPARSIVWPTTRLVYGTSPTMISYTISTLPTHSPHPGNSTTRRPTSAPQ